MKRFLLITTIIFAAFATKAQTEKGKVVLGGQLEFTSVVDQGFKRFEGDPTDATLSYLLKPSIGYFFREDLSIGAAFGYSFSRHRNELR